MLRWLATAGILALLALDVFLPATSLGRRGPEPAVRGEVAGAAGTLGERLPDFQLLDLDGRPFTLADLRGQRVLLTFERSVDW